MTGKFKKLPSDSSASKTAQSPFPSLAELFMEFITPPLIIVGSSLASYNILEINEVVVVFPCEPVITIFFLSETTCASISALFKIFNFLFFAKIISGLVFPIAEDFTMIVEFLTLCLLCFKKILIPFRLHLSIFLLKVISLP